MTECILFVNQRITALFGTWGARSFFVFTFLRHLFTKTFGWFTRISGAVIRVYSNEDELHVGSTSHFLHKRFNKAGAG
jgi:hypothetical protein